MKKTNLFLLTLSLALVLCSTSAFADAKIKTTDKFLFVEDGEYSGYFFARIENVGDSGAYVDYGGSLVAFDADDEIIFSNDYVCAIPYSLYLAPGEHAFVRDYIFETALKTNKIADYKFSMKTDTSGYRYDVVESTAKLAITSIDSYENKILVTCTNNTSEIWDGLTAVAAIYDADGNLMYVNYESSESIMVHPNSTVTIVISIDRATLQYCHNHGMIPTTVESIVYINKR